VVSQSPVDSSKLKPRLSCSCGSSAGLVAAGLLLGVEDSWELGGGASASQVINAED
jgi:hypothetical protein